MTKPKTRPSLGKVILLIILASQAARLPLGSLLVAMGLADKPWQAHDFGMHISMCLATWFIARQVPYQRLPIKFMAIAWFAFELVAASLSAVNLFTGIVIRYMVTAQCAVAMVVCLAYYLRTTFYEGDTVDDVNLFIIRRRPHRLQDAIIGMVDSSGLGGFGVYYRGQYWHYRHGVMVKDVGVTPCAAHVLMHQGIPSQELIDKLDGMVGRKWSIFNNCVTTLYLTVKLGDRRNTRGI